MSIVIALIILGVGVFSFLVVSSSLSQQSTVKLPASTASETQNATYNETGRAAYNSIQNSSGVGNQVFNIIGVVMIIGAIMAIVGLVYNHVK